MAKKKKVTGSQTAKPLSPQEYIRTKARQLPVHKCYKFINEYEDREMSIIVVRRHPHGTYSFGAYLIDKWCLGVKDAVWRFSVEEDELDDFLTYFRESVFPICEIDYTEAHNWVYGALAYARDAGIEPHKDFEIAQYFLEEDDDHVELIEYEFGRDGKYCLLAKNRLEASRYIPILDRSLGKGNYSVEIDESDNEVYDDDDFDDDDFDDELIQKFKFPFMPTPTMEYTYKGRDYPKHVKLFCPKVEELLIRDICDLSDEDIEWIQSLPAAELRTDLQNLILRELYRQWGKTGEELDEDKTVCWPLLGNALVFLINIATVDETLPVVLEVMRQSQDFLVYYFSDVPNLLLDPVLCVLIKDHPRLLKPFLLEEGLNPDFKILALELLEIIACNCPEVRPEIIDMTVELLNEYKSDLPYRKVCDGTVTGFAIGILISTGEVKYLPLVEEIYATNLVDEFCEGHIEEVRQSFHEPRHIMKLPLTDPYAIRDHLRKFSKD